MIGQKCCLGKGVLPVGDVQQHRGILTVLARAVDLQLHVEEAGPGAVEDGTGLEIVVVDGTVLDVGAAVAAIGVVVVVGIPAVIKGDEAAAAGTAGVVSVIAAGAKGRRRGVAVVPMPEAGAAADADLCHAIQTVRAQQAVTEFDQVLGGTAAVGAGANRRGHSEIPPKCKVRPPGITRRPSFL